MEISKAVYDDLPEILQLQKLAYQSEAELLGDYSIPPLRQTLLELEEEFGRSIVLKITDDKTGKIIGSIRATEQNGRVYVAKLIVHQDYRNKGLGTRLLTAIEVFYENKTFELFTSNRSDKNLYLYNRCGYREFRRERVSEYYDFVFLEKNIL